MSMNFDQIPPQTTDLVDLEYLKNRCQHFISDAIDPILFKRAGNEDLHNILMRSNFSQIEPSTTEFVALSVRKNSNILIM